MSQYKLVLIDDEEIVLMGIQKTYHMENYGFELVECFTSPTKALSSLKDLQPDLIITDIRMPRMSGLELAQKAKELLPDVEIVIMSGYDDFSYAQAAVKVGVQDYLLKPVKKEDYENMLLTLHHKIEEKKSQKADVTHLKKEVKIRENEIKNYFFLDLMEEPFCPSPRLQKTYESLGLDFIAADFFLLKFDYSDAVFIEDTMSTLDHMMREFTEELESFGDVEAFYSDEYLFFLLYNVTEDLSSVILEVARDYADHHTSTGLQLSLGMSDYHNGIEELFAANCECNRLLWTAHMDLEEMTDDFTYLRNHHMSIPYADLEDLFQSITANNKEGLLHAIGKIYSLPRTLPSPLAENYTYSLTFLILLRMYQIQSTTYAGRRFIPIELQQLKNLRSLYPKIQEQEDLIRQISISIMEYMKDQEVTTSAPSKNVARVLEYINQHYTDNISLAETAHAVGLSKSYLSDIFKKEIGITFLSYITNLRIEKAKLLLSDSNMKMYEISDAVGFQDYTYFSQIFKKKVGMTLSDYRKTH